MVALKVEKADKSKKILIFEYQVLQQLQGTRGFHRLGLPHICQIYDFIKSDKPGECNFIVMQMLGMKEGEGLGNNLSTVKKQKGKDFTRVTALGLLVRK